MCLGSQRRENMVQVLASPLFIITTINPRSLIQELTHMICTSSHWPRGSASQEVHPYGKTEMPRYDMASSLALVLGMLQNFLC